MNEELDYTWEEDLLDWEGEEETINWDSLSKDEYCKTLIAYYPHQQDDFNDYNWKDMFNKYNDYMNYCSDESKTLYNELDDEITIYRGADKDEESKGFGISWTLNPRVALYFAYDRYKDKDEDTRMVYTRRIKKSQIKAIFTEMDEDEVIVTDIK